MKKNITNTIRLYQESYSGHPKEVWVLVVMCFINRVGTMVIPFLTIYLTTILHFTLKQAGFLMGGFGLGSLAGSYLAGKLIDRIGAKWVITGSLFLSGLMLIFLQFASSFYFLLLLITLTGLFGDAYRPAMGAQIGEFVDPSQTSRSWAFLRLAVNLGMSISPVIGGFAASSLGYSWLFWIDGITCILASFYYTYYSWNWKATLTKAEKKEAEAKDSGLPPYRNKAYLVFLLASIFMGLGFVQWFHTIPVFIKTVWGYDERFVGILIAINCLIITLIEMPVVHAYEKANRTKPAIRLGLVMTAMSFLPFLLPGSVMAALLGMLMFTAGEIFYFPFNNAAAIHMSPPSKRGEYMSWYWMAWSLTNIVGPTLGFSFIQSFGFQAFWICICLIVFISLFINMNYIEKGQGLIVAD